MTEPELDVLIERLGPIVSGGDSSCLNKTPMVPLHKQTVAKLLEVCRSLKGARKALRDVQFENLRDGLTYQLCERGLDA